MLYNDEIENYPLPFGQGAPNGSYFEHWGHFSQMVWSTTTSVGCYTYDCSPPGQPATQDCNADGHSYLTNTTCGPDGGTPAVFTVCNYYPPGKNVFRSSSEAVYGEADQLETGNVDGEYELVNAPLGHGVVQMGADGLTGPGL